MNVTLVYPPNRNIPAAPYGSLPLLAGCLGVEGHKTSIVDVNLEVFDRLLKPETIAMAEGFYDEAWAELHPERHMTVDRLMRLQGLAGLGIVPFERLYQAQRAGEIVRDPVAFRDPEQLNWAYDTIANLVRLVYSINPLFYGHKKTFNDELFGYLEGGFDNPISQIVERDVLPQIVATKPDVIGMCIPFNEQLVEGFSLMAQIKRVLPDVKIIAGGAIISAFHEHLCSDPRFYQYADFGMPGESDRSLPDFVNALQADSDMAEVPNLWHKDKKGEVHAPSRRDLPNLNEIAHPDFTQIQARRYYLPEPMATYQTSRGCYYGKCTFCSFDIKQNFRFRRPDLVIEDITRIQEQGGVRHFTFWDPLTPPKLMKHISRWNRERPADEQIFWGAETKFERIFTDQAFTDLLYEGGARFMQFGFESGSQRVLDLMVKGNDLERVHLMLGALERSKIAVSVQWFVGFPGETEEEAVQSYRYLDDHRDSVLLSSYMGKFTLSPDDDIMRSDGDLYDIEIRQDDDGKFRYTHKDGTERYDPEELHYAYLTRGDSESVTRFAFFLYLTQQPERAREISGFERGGALPLSWEEIANVAPTKPEANFLAKFDFDLFTPATEQVTEEGSERPQRNSYAVFVTQTQMTRQLSEDEFRLAEAVDGQRTFAELLRELSIDSPAMRERLVHLVKVGVFVVPLPAKVAQALSA